MGGQWQNKILIVRTVQFEDVRQPAFVGRQITGATPWTEFDFALIHCPPPLHSYVVS
jgi:hypothetical protein